jgi:hypothetical protein
MTPESQKIAQESPEPRLIDLLVELVHKTELTDDPDTGEDASYIALAPSEVERRLNLAINAIRDLTAAAAKHLRAAQADAEDRFLIDPDPGCLECTSGTTPHDRNTGLCGYHALERALAKVSP